MSYKKIYFRADGSEEIGLGHLYRCISVAEMLKSEFEIHFFTTTEQKIFKMINASNFEFHILHSETHFEYFLNQLNGDEIVVLDNYFFDTQHMLQIKKKGSLLASIDDIADRHFVADLVINHGPGVKESIYSKEKHTKLLLGINYALLRPAFLHQNKNINTNKDESWFICFGGSDSQDLTIKTLELLNKYHPSTIINIIVGGKYINNTVLNSLINASPHKINFFSSIGEKQMLQLLQSSQYGIVACSSILIEALSTGLSCIGIKYVDNQELILKFMTKEEPNGIYFDSSLRNLEYQDIIDLKNKQNVSTNLIDLKSGNRILKEFIQLKNKSLMQLRKAKRSDALIYFEWANDPSVRANSFQTEPILLENHMKWFNSRLTSESTYLFIAEYEGIPCGQIRFDIIDDKAFVALSIPSNYRGKKLGTTLIRKGMQIFDAVINKDIPIVAEIKITNQKSINSFKSINFIETEIKNINGNKSIILTYP